MPEDFTTIRIQRVTKGRIESLGKMGDTPDDVINRLIDLCEKNKLVQTGGKNETH